MKKNLILMLLCLSAFSLTACKKEPEEDTRVQELHSAIEEASEREESEKQEESEPEEEEIILIDEPADEQITKVLENLKTWAGTKYFYDPVTEYTSLDDTTMIEMAAFISEMASGDSDEQAEYTDDWRMIISNATMNETMQALFGQSFDPAKYEYYKNSYVSVIDSDIAISQGDWGLTVPNVEYDIQHDKESNNFVVEANYSAYDFVQNTNVTGYDYRISYECEISEESANGFIIKNITSHNYGVLPIPFDPATVAGIYAYEYSNASGSKESTYAYLELRSDGTGVWHKTNSTQIKFDGYDIEISSANVTIPYTYYEGEITLYPSDDESEHYVKIDVTAEQLEELMNEQ